MIEEADYSMTNQAFDRAGQNTGDETLAVRFERRPYQNTAKSEEAGRPIFEDIDFIEIRAPGNKMMVVCEKVTEAHKLRFPEHWRRYVARENEDFVEGTPLTEWPGVTRSQVEELRFLNIRSLEQLVAVADNHGARVMGINALKTKAAAYLEAAKVQSAANVIASTQAQLAEQIALNEKLVARLDALEDIVELPGKRRGRPPKVSEE